MKTNLFSILILILLGSSFLAAQGCRIKPTTSPDGGSATSTPTVTVPTATPTPVVIQFVTAANFNTVVMNSTVPVMVDCEASWCYWCAQLDPTIQQVAQDTARYAKVVKVDCSNGVPSFMAPYGVTVYPTVLLFHHHSFVGHYTNVYNTADMDACLAGL